MPGAAPMSGMSVETLRKKHTGRPGNAGHFDGRERHDAAGVDLTAQAGPFVFNGDYGDLAQVARHYEAYDRRYRELVDADKYPYNDSFTGHIEGLAGASPADESAAIYMLQTLREVKKMEAEVEDFGGEDLTEVPAGVVLRGDVAQYGWYMGGIGFKVFHDVRVKADAHGRLMVVEKGRRNGTYVQGRARFRTR